jgi:acetyl-CoA C-acetyltransferase
MQVGIVGIGQTKFGKLSDSSSRELATDVDGGLLAKGHPVGATGAGHIIAIANQLRNEAGASQVPKARIGLAHNIGGIGIYAVCTVLRASQ